MNQRVVVTNFIWRLLERFGAQGVGLVVSIILARLLDPSVYGTIALVTVFLTILQVFVDSGLGTALIQKKNADSLDFSSVFYFNLFVCVIIYSLLYLCAPIISSFYEREELTLIIRVIGLTVIISGVKGIQQSYVSKNMMFKKFFFSTICGTVLSAVIGIVMAYMKCGVWALVVQNLSNSMIDTLILWLTVPWRPTKEFSISRLKDLLSFGWKLLIARLLTTVYTNFRQLIIGRFYSSEELAFYNKGHEFPTKIVPNIQNAVTNVLLPTVASKQEDINAVLNMTRKSVRIMSYLIWPLMIGMVACGSSIVSILLTNKWLPSVIYLQIFCIDAAFWPISAVYNNVINALGRSDINLKVQSIIRILGIIILFLVLKLGTFIIAITAVGITIIEFLTVATINRSLIGYRIRYQLNDIVPPMLLSIGMGFIVWGIGKSLNSCSLILLIQIVCGFIIYSVGSVIFKIDSFGYILNIFKKSNKQ